MIIMISSSLIESRICKLLFIAVRDPWYPVTVWECPHVPKYMGISLRYQGNIYWGISQWGMIYKGTLQCPHSLTLSVPTSLEFGTLRVY